MFGIKYRIVRNTENIRGFRRHSDHVRRERLEARTGNQLAINKQRRPGRLRQVGNAFFVPYDRIMMPIAPILRRKEFGIP